ncbi:unnamed protein product, partial [Meganyctiphanes norvegica]
MTFSDSNFIMQHMHSVTPLIHSSFLSQLCGRKVLLKMENTQPSGSFKIRGIGHFVQQSKAEGCDHVVSSSGGNAGMAAAYAARKCGLPATIVIPESTPSLMISRLEGEEAKVMVHGKNWDGANEKAQELAKEKTCCFVHPFEHPLIWEGHSTLVDEILEQSAECPSAIIVSVGGGGMLCGVLKGLHKKDTKNIAIIAMETQGANCLNEALKVGHPVSIGSITSIAKTLGSLTVTQGVFDLKEGINLISQVISDRDAVEACVRFADDHRALVEPSCGASLAAVYKG